MEFKIEDINSKSELKNLFKEFTKMAEDEYSSDEGFEITYDGKPMTMGEVTRAALGLGLLKETIELVEEVIGCCGDAWQDEEMPFALEAATELAKYDARYITLFTAYILSTDLDHEVYQFDQVAEVIDHYGWNTATYRLYAELMFRSQRTSGSFPSFILDHLKASEENESAFLQILESERKHYASTESDHYANLFFDDWIAELNKQKSLAEIPVDDDSFHPDRDMWDAITSDDADKVIWISKHYTQEFLEQDNGLETLLIRSQYQTPGYWTLEFVKKLVENIGSDNLKKATADNYIFLNALYDDYGKNREVIDFLHSNKALAYCTDFDLSYIYEDIDSKCQHPAVRIIRNHDYEVGEKKALLKEIVERGANLDQPLRRGNRSKKTYETDPSTVLMLLLQYGPLSADMANHLFDLGASLETKFRIVDGDGRVTIKSLIQSSLCSLAYEKGKIKRNHYLKIIMRQLNAGVDVSENAGSSIFKYALEAGNLEVLDALKATGHFEGEEYDISHLKA